MLANYAGEPIKEHGDKLTAAEIQQAEAEAADFIRGVIERAKEGERDWKAKEANKRKARRTRSRQNQKRER